MLIVPIEGSKTTVTHEVTHVLMPDQVKSLRRQGAWPTEFSDASCRPPSPAVDDDVADDDVDDPLMRPNTNRIEVPLSPSSSDDLSESD